MSVQYMMLGIWKKSKRDKLHCTRHAFRRVATSTWQKQSMPESTSQLLTDVSYRMARYLLEFPLSLKRANDSDISRGSKQANDSDYIWVDFHQ